MTTTTMTVNNFDQTSLFGGDKEPLTMPLPKLTYRVSWFVEEPSCRQWQQRYFDNRDEAEYLINSLKTEPANVSIRIEVLP